MNTVLVTLVLLASPLPPTPVGGGDVEFEVKGESRVVFSHEAHVVAARLGCRDCHPKLFLDTTRSKRVTMAQMKKGQSCGACHDGKRAAGLDDCGSCHR